MPFCTSCGHENTDEARFCNGCGQAMPIATQPAPTVPTAPPQPAYQPPHHQQQPAPPPPHQQPPPPPVYQQPAYQQPAYQQPYRPAKDKSTATILAWLLGGLGVADFYLGNTGKGIAKLLTLGGFGVWALIDAIKLLSMSQQEFDARYNSGR